MIQPKNPLVSSADVNGATRLEESLSKLDLKGLLVLNGIITQQALKLILDSETVVSKFKNPLLLPNQPKLI